MAVVASVHARDAYKIIHKGSFVFEFVSCTRKGKSVLKLPSVIPVNARIEAGKEDRNRGHDSTSAYIA